MQTRVPFDVLIIGAGAAGLAAGLDLARAGLRVAILEARDRVGGRIFTRQDPTLHHPVELGAEFVHGLAAEIWQPIQQNHLPATEVGGDLWCSLRDKLERCNFFAQAEKILGKMSDHSPDESFLEFLARCFPGDEYEEAKRWATGYVSGFNAADPALVSVHWLVHTRRAEEQIEGDRAFRIAGGYQTLINTFLNELNKQKVTIKLSTTVSEVEWHPGSIQVDARTRRRDERFTAPRALITLPLGVLHSDSVRFEPELPEAKRRALAKLAMGKVVRVTLCFRERFWESLRSLDENKSLAAMSFLFSRDELFPTWWTQMLEPVPVITGWAPAPSAERLAGMTEGRVIDKAVETLSHLLRIEKSAVQQQLVSAYYHDWDSDPFSLGAYSYVKVGGEGCQQTLSAPLDNTLFFAGEATDISGHNGTVHGAIASGKRAAAEVLQSK